MTNCQEPRAGGIFSDDGGAYRCPKCLALHTEYFRVMAKIDADQMAFIEKDGGWGRISRVTGDRGHASSSSYPESNGSS
jgi:hypothetical protein